VPNQISNVNCINDPCHPDKHLARSRLCHCSKHVCWVDMLAQQCQTCTVQDASPERAFYQSFGMMLAEARRRRNISQEMLADELGLSRTSVTNIERGRQPIQLHTLYVIARLFSVDVKELLPSWAIGHQPDQSQALSVSRSEWLEQMNVKLPEGVVLAKAEGPRKRNY
jgi:transcriptional regulator with XRE-family HTH domain